MSVGGAGGAHSSFWSYWCGGNGCGEDGKHKKKRHSSNDGGVDGRVGQAAASAIGHGGNPEGQLGCSLNGNPFDKVLTSSGFDPRTGKKLDATDGETGSTGNSNSSANVPNGDEKNEPFSGDLGVIE